MKNYKLINKQFFSAILILTAGIFAMTATANAAAPANDNLANAITLPEFGAINGTTVEATREDGEFSYSLSDSTAVYRTVWFQWTADATKPALFAITSASGGFDPSIAVYTGNSYPLTSLTANNDTNGNLPYVEFMAQSGVTYKIVVGVYDNADAVGGTFNLICEQVDAPTNNNFAQAKNLQTTSGSVALTNQNATSEPNEQFFGGGKSVWYNFTNPTPNDLSVTFTTRRD